MVWLAYASTRWECAVDGLGVTFCAFGFMAEAESFMIFTCELLFGESAVTVFRLVISIYGKLAAAFRMSRECATW